MNKTVYKQTDERWRWWVYPKKGWYLNGCGCGCLSVFHCVIELPKYKKHTVMKVMKPVYEYMRQYATCGNGTYRVGITNALKHFGFEDVTRNESKPMSYAFERLNKGSRVGVIVFVKTNSKGRTIPAVGPDGTCWTTGGHYIAFTAYKVQNGKHYFYMKDSAGRNHSGWYCYETSMRGCVADIWTAKIPEETKSEKSKNSQGENSKKSSEKTVAKSTRPPIPSIHLSRTADQCRKAAVKFGKFIAADNSFHYGHGKAAHHNGCYICKTQPKSKKNAGIKDWEKTYCCNPLIHGCYAHGAMVPSMLKKCQNGSSFGFTTNEGYAKSNLFKKIKASEVDYGDVGCSNSHVVMAIDKDRIVEAAGGDDNVPGSKSWNNSIHVRSKRDMPRWYRFVGHVDADMAIQKGEYSSRVGKLQAYLNWYFDKKVCAEDDFFFDTTEKYLKKFQKKRGLEADGKCGKATLKEMKAVTKPGEEKAVK